MAELKTATVTYHSVRYVSVSHDISILRKYFLPDPPDLVKNLELGYIPGMNSCPDEIKPHPAEDRTESHHLLL